MHIGLVLCAHVSRYFWDFCLHSNAVLFVLLTLKSETATSISRNSGWTRRPHSLTDVCGSFGDVDIQFFKSLFFFFFKSLWSTNWISSTSTVLRRLQIFQRLPQNTTATSKIAGYIQLCGALILYPDVQKCLWFVVTKSKFCSVLKLVGLVGKSVLPVLAVGRLFIYCTLLQCCGGRLLKNLASFP